MYPVFNRDVVSVLKLEGPNYNGSLSPPKNWGGPSILLLNKIPKNWGGPGPPGPLGHYTPARILFFAYYGRERVQRN